MQIPVWEQLATDQTDPWQVVPKHVFTPYDCLLISVAFVFSVALVVSGKLACLCCFLYFPTWDLWNVHTDENFTIRPDFTSNLVHGSAFGTPKFYIAPYGKINHGLVNRSHNCDVKSGFSCYIKLVD